ncbi:MAG: hypothetical protein HN727_11485 [Opitutae bacterium]|nr:hypothetical protein [Opitutae bacterium]
MARQLIFTSAPQGLEPGRSGYCTVARHKDIRSRLVRELERLSVYDYNQQGEGPKAKVALFRKLALGSEEFFVISRISDAGLDYTNRTNYIAHHLILDSFEIATVPSPAEILANWNGWKSKWEEGPRYLEDSEEVDLSLFKSPALIPANGWLAATNDPGNAAILVSPSMKKPVLLEVHPGQEESLLKLFAESSALHKLSLDAWDYSFTTFLQENDDAKMFSWIGARGQPVAERMKQGGSPNYLDLRDFAQSKVVDPIDDDLAHIARKGPKAKAAGAKSPKTRAKAPKAFSDREMVQFQQAASSYTASAAPSGSTVSAQDGSSAGKKRKKRPWLMQLAVISTALCLLVGLVVGLAYNLGDFLNKNGDEPDPDNPPIVSPDPDVTPDLLNEKPVVEGATLMVGRPGVVVLREKHKYMNWIKLDAGSPEPITINLTEQQQDDYGDFLEGLESDDQLQVTVVRNEAGRLAIETLDDAPAVQAIGEPFKGNISGQNAVSLDRDIATFNIPSKGELTYELPSDQPELREQIEKLVAALNENPTMEVPLNLRLEEGRIVGIDPISIPGISTDPVDPVRPEPTGVPKTMVLNAPDAARILPDQRIVEIKVDGVRSLPYQFREEEEERIRNLVAFLDAGGKDLKLDAKVDGDRITFLDFTIPAAPVAIVPVGPDPSGPLVRTPESAYVLWLPAKTLPGKPVRWQLDLPSSGSVKFEQPSFSSLFDALMRAFIDVEQAHVWQTDFHGPQSFYNLADAADDFEPFAVEVEADRVDPESQARFSLKTVGTGRSIYSLEFNVKRGVSVEIDFSADMAKNAADRGFVLRIPKGTDSCVDLYFVSNKHFVAELGYPPVPRGDQLKLSGSTLRFLPSWAYGQNFHVLTKGKNESHSLALVPALGAGGTARPDVFFSPSMPSVSAFVMGYVQGFPKAIVMPHQGPQPVSEVKMDVEYFASLVGSFQSEIAKYDAEMKRLSATLPNPQVYDNLRMFGRNAAKSTDYSLGSSYGEYLLEVTTKFAQQTFGWDDPQTITFRKKFIGLSDPKSFHASEQSLGQFWRTVATKLKEEAERPMDGFRYNAERADHDVDIAFRLVNFFMHVERIFGMKDTNLAGQLQQVRESFDSQEPEKGLLGKLQKEILRMGEQPKGKEVGQKFTKFNKAYLEHASQSIPSDKLVWQEYSKALKLMSDAAAVARFSQERAKLSQYDQWLKRMNAKFIELKAARDAAFRAGGSQILQSRQRLVAEKWALALFKINPPVARQPVTWDRVSDLVTFR